MNFMKLGVAVIVFTAVLRQVAAGELPAELQGTWKLVTVEREGESALQPERQPRLVFKGDDATHGGEKVATVTADAAASPKIIDWRFSEPDRTLEGIYSIDGDTLKICLNTQTEGAKERPEALAVKGHESYRLLIFERDKGEGQDGASGYVGLLLRSSEEHSEISVDSTIKGGPAEKAGLQKGDIILKIAGEAISELRPAVAAVQRAKPGEQLSILIRRDGKESEIKIKTALRPFAATAQLN
jgi:uncharacterized protein (TIGR03067 family)